MTGILDILNSDLGKSIISGIADSTGTDSTKTSSVLTMGLPVLMKALERNSTSEEGTKGLMSALDNKHDGSILDNLGGLFNGGVNENVLQDGAGILRHILGGKQNGIAQVIGQKVGLDAASVNNILKIAAPILMGILGKQKKENSLENANDLTGLFGNLLGGSSAKNEQGFLEQMLDTDGDGSVIDDVAGMFLGGNKKQSGGIGGMLGGLLGK